MNLISKHYDFTIKYQIDINSNFTRQILLFKLIIN